MSCTIRVVNNAGSTAISPDPAMVYAPQERAVIVVMPKPGSPGGLVVVTDLGTDPAAPPAGGVLVQSGSFSARASYAGPQGHVVVTLGPDGTFSVSGVAPSIHQVPIAGPRPSALSLPAGWPVHVEARTGLQRAQRLTLLLNQGGITSWEGAEGGKPYVDAQVRTPAHPSGRVVASILLESSLDKGRSWAWSRAQAGILALGPYQERVFLPEESAEREVSEGVARLSWWQPHWL